MVTPRSGGEPGAPRVLAVLPQLIPSTLIGVVKPLLALHREKRVALDVALESRIDRRQLTRADVVVFCRNTEPRHGAWLDTALALGKPFIYELDDNFFAMPPDTPDSLYHRAPERLAQLERYLRHASLVRVYSEALRARVAAINPHVHRVDGLIDWDLVPAERPRTPPGPLRVVYATSRIVDTLAALFMTDLRRALDRFEGRVHAWFLGYAPAELLGRADVHHVKFVHDYDAFFRQFAGAGFDIGLAPLHDDEFHRSKSDNKFREYAAARVAGVYSDVDVYRECVNDGRTGLLVPPRPGAWLDALTGLIEDAALRRSIQDAAWSYARARYGIAQSKEAWLSHLAAALRAPATPRAMTRAPSSMSDGRGLLRRAARAIRRPLAVGAALQRRLASGRALAKLKRELARH